MVRILARRKRPEDVSQDLHHAGQGERREIPRSISHQMGRMKEEGDREENNAQDAERKIGSIAVYDNPRIMRAMRIREAGVNKASASR